jgi:tetratricopeptide (TPR) repeat protein
VELSAVKSPGSGRRFTLGFAGVLTGLLALAYGNSFGVGFLFDDAWGIAQNPAIRSFASVPRYFVDPFLLTPVRENVDVRPVLMISFALNYAISQLSPWSWHALNVIVHFASALLVFFCVRDHVWWPREERGADGAARWPAAAAALFFALAPLNQQPVVYMWARSALLCTALSLGAFLAFLKERRALSAALFALALLTKAIAAILPLLVVVYLLLERRKVGKSLWPLLAVLAAYLSYRALLLPAWSEDARHEIWVTRWIWLMSGWTSYLYYARLFVWPDALSVDHDFAYNLAFFTWRTLLSLAAVLGWIGFAAAGARRRPAVAFATAWYFLALAPETTLSPISEVINDHRPYFASALGLALLLAWVLWTAARHLVRRPEVALAALTLCACAVATPVVRQRNWIWQDGLRLWLDAEEKGPGNGRAAMNAGRELMARGRLDEARARFVRARELMPENPYLYMNRSVLESAQGHPEAAVEEARKAMDLAPHNPIARQYYERALSAGRAETLMERGLDALYRRGDPQAAVEAFARVLGKDPQHYGATFQSAVALERLGRKDEARRMWARSAEMAGRYGDEATAQTAREHLGK